MSASVVELPSFERSQHVGRAERRIVGTLEALVKRQARLMRKAVRLQEEIADMDHAIEDAMKQVSNLAELRGRA